MNTNKNDNKNKLLTITILISLLFTACEDPEFIFNGQADPYLTEGLILQYAIGQIARPVFYASYDYSASSGYCRNHTKIPVLDYSSSDAACQNDTNCTVQTTVCSSTNVVGACTVQTGFESRTQDVYYSPTYSESTAASACTSLSGVFSASYVP